SNSCLRATAMQPVTRRDLISGIAVTGASVLGLPLAGVAEDQPTAKNPLKVIVVGGHPDDPESGCGGTMARLADLGHDVVAMYLRRGGHGIPGEAHEDAADCCTGGA